MRAAVARRILATGTLVGLAVVSVACGDDCSWPGEGWLAYLSVRDQQYGVRLVRADGRCDRSVGEDEAEFSPSHSIRRASTVYLAARQGVGRVVIRNVFMGAERVLELGALVVERPEVSPDGRWVAFEGATPPAKADIYVVPVDGGAPRVLAADPADDAAPAWSADGRFVYFGSTRSGRYQLWRVNVDGSAPEQVTTDDTAALRCGASACAVQGKAAPSPDGGLVAFTRATPAREGAVIIRDLASGAERVLADAPDADPSWSPDGNRIAVVTLAFDDPEIVVRDARTGSLLERVTESPGIESAPSWAR